MDETARGSMVFWVVQNDTGGDEQEVSGGFLAPPALTCDVLVYIEAEWRKEHPYGRADAFIDWLSTAYPCKRVPVEVYPFG